MVQHDCGIAKNPPRSGEVGLELLDPSLRLCQSGPHLGHRLDFGQYAAAAAAVVSRALCGVAGVARGVGEDAGRHALLHLHAGVAGTRETRVRVGGLHMGYGHGLAVVSAAPPLQFTPLQFTAVPALPAAVRIVGDPRTDAHKHLNHVGALLLVGRGRWRQDFARQLAEIVRERFDDRPANFAIGN